jgi:hypothetical protein
MSASDYLENALLKHLVGEEAFTQPDLYLALFTTAPQEDGTGGVEVSGTYYSRIELTDWSSVSNGTVTNSTLLTFPTAGSGGWGVIKAWGIYDDLTGGNLLLSDVVAEEKTIGNGDTVEIAVGDLSISLD